MKRYASAVLALLLAVLLMAGSAAAERDGDVPFPIDPPQNVTLAYLDGSDSPTTHTISYSVGNSMNRFLIGLAEADDREAYLSEFGLSEFIVTVQMDWALDDVDDPVSGWHYNKYWDLDPDYGFGADAEGRYHYSDWDVLDTGLNSNETVQEMWVFRGLPNDDRWNGNPETGWVGVKEQLNPDQYTYDEANEELHIDFAKHTIYARLRYVFWGTKLGAEERSLFGYSDWSNVASSGKDSEKIELPKELPAPEIVDLRMTNETFNGNPVAAYTLTVPDELAKTATELAALRGGIRIYTEARVKGDSEWIAMQNADWLIETGEMQVPLLHLLNDSRTSIPKDTPIEIRCRYVADAEGMEEELQGPYSKVLSFGTEDVTQGGNETVKPTDEQGPDEPGGKKTCPICHFCPQPLGLCIFIWLAIILCVVVIIVIAVARGKKKKDKK